MIKIQKRPLPSDVVIKREKDYRSGPVFQMLVADCHNKCYICEDSLHTSPNVEHRISHKHAPALKYDWENLFLSCSHCNNIKGDKYDGMIDPAQCDPEQVIALSMGLDDELREVVIVSKTGGDEAVDITVALLNAVYNGTHTDMKKYACQQLKNKISNELAWFQQKLDDYKNHPGDDTKAAVAGRISEDALFAAFKRKRVREDPQLAPVFGFGGR
ncbi:MAG: HNH endonuclease [Oscillospiraceae bacterium]|jgi:hypothetical protein|nr:HNH endonuclease [Oscillospiraceae bacterium]